LYLVPPLAGSVPSPPSPQQFPANQLYNSSRVGIHSQFLFSLKSNIIYRFRRFKLMDFLIHLTLFTPAFSLIKNSFNYSFGVKTLCDKANALS
jgi:hypothetical protein